MNTTETKNTFDFDIVALSSLNGESFDKKILYWDESEMNVKEFINDFTEEEINRMAECLENSCYDGLYTHRYVSHFTYTYFDNDRITIIYDYLRSVLIDCLAYDSINAFLFYNKQFNRFLSVFD